MTARKVGEFSKWPLWTQALTLWLGAVCIVLEICFHLRRASGKIENRGKK